MEQQPPGVAVLDIKLIREDPELVRESIRNRGMPTEVADVDGVLELDARRRELLVQVEELKHRRNQASEEIVALKKSGADTGELVREMKEISERVKGMDSDVREVEERVRELMLDIPNVPHESVPVGPDESANVEVRLWGEPPGFTFAPRPHWEIGDRSTYWTSSGGRRSRARASRC